MTTFSIRAKDIQRNWYLVDAKDKTLGRLSSEIARRLRGKHKPEYTPHMDVGDYIVVINAKYIQVSGNKRTDKVYYRHSGYPGGIKSITFEKYLEKKPERIIEMSVKGMLPKGPLGRAMFKKMRVYPDKNHKQQAQNPVVLNI